MQKGLRLWHEYVEAGDLSLLPEMFTEDCVFISPVVHTPQRGKDITVLYLSGAMHVLKIEFRYLKEIVTDTHAALEVECKVDDIIVNGIDILTFSEDILTCSGRTITLNSLIRPSSLKVRMSMTSS